MRFQNCSIIIPVIRETDLFESVVQLIVESCDANDIKEFIVVVHPQLTAKESYFSIEKMRGMCERRGISYTVLDQTLPGMGGAMRDAISVAKGSHVIIQNADMALNPRLVAELIRLAKQYPDDVVSVSRYVKGGGIEEGYDKLKLRWNRMAQLYCSILFCSKVTDYTYAYRICPARYYHAVEWEEVKHPFALEGTLKFIRLGIKFHEIPGTQIGGSQSGYGETMLYLPVSLRVRLMRRSRILKPGVSLKELKGETRNE